MLFLEFLKITVENIFYTIDNGSTKNIVLFGNCHMASICMYLNILTDKKYNIYVILTYVRINEKPYDQMEKEKIWNTIKQSNIFIYQKHYNDINIMASTIDKYASNKKILIPNLQLFFTHPEGKDQVNKELIDGFEYSYNKTKSSIIDSDMSNFIFVSENCKKIRFFDIPAHPTLYILYLLALQIFYKINDSDHEITLNDYYEMKQNFTYIPKNEHLILSNVFTYKKEECDALNIDYNSEHYIPIK
jgi:hypothetical protein